MSLRTGSGGGVRPIMVLDSTTWITMIVAYIPATAPAPMGSMCGVSRLLKHIPVYGFYGYWRIKEKHYAIASAGTIVNKDMGVGYFLIAIFRRGSRG